MEYLGAEWQGDKICLHFKGEDGMHIITMDAHDLVTFETRLGVWMDQQRDKLFESMRREFARRKDFVV